MATSSHAMMLREISAAGDRERTGALDVAWDRAHASVFFKFGNPRHVTFEMADGRILAGDDALTALVAELPTEIYVASWRRAAVTEETLDLTADELIALFEAEAPSSNGSAPPHPGPVTDTADDTDPEPSADPVPPAEAAASADPVPPAAEPTASAIPDFPLLPLGPVLWSDAMANVLDLEAMVPLLPDCLLVLTCPEPHAAALVTEGAFADAVWMTGGRRLFGDDAARELMGSREGVLTAYRVDDHRMFGVLRKLLREPGALVIPETALDTPSEPEVAPELTEEPPVPIAEHADAEEATPEAAPTFDLAFAYVGMSGREDAATAPALEPPPPVPAVEDDAEALTWSTREPATSRFAAQPVPIDVDPPLAPPAPSQSSFGPVGATRPALLVPVRVVLSLGIYALVWHHRTNRELEAFDPKLHAKPARSTLASFVAWLAALMIALAGGVLLASTRLSFHLPLDRQLTSAQTYYLIGGLAILYLTLILPFRLAAVRTSLVRLRSVEEHVGITTTSRAGRVAAAPLLTIPVAGGLVLLGVEQRRINAIWKAAGSASAPAAEAIVNLTPAAVEVAEPEADPAEPAVEPEAVPIEAAVEPDATAAELGAIFSEIQAESTVLRIAAPHTSEDVEPVVAAVPSDTTANGQHRTEPTKGLEAGVIDEAVPADVPAPPMPAWFKVPALQEEPTAEADAPILEPEAVVEPAPTAKSDALEAPEFFPPRLEFDVSALRGGLTDIAVRWLGADAATPVTAVVATTRPGVDDFVFAIAAIRAMEIPGYETRIVRAMAREMHFYATEVLCGV